MVSNKTSILLATLFVTAVPLVSAQQDCATKRSEEGQIAFELCIKEERESTIRANVAEFKKEIDDDISNLREILDQEDDRIDLEKDRVKFEVKAEINGLNRRIKLMRRNDASSDEIALERAKISELRTAERLYIRVADKEYDILEDEVNKQIAVLELSLVNYERTLRESATHVRIR